ncbi:hypothetical protein K439DRAFT_1078085 [Ramaria rubella]|nr:hypothetical protein K439DRAFT_1078085 [Ramaria rubella]
MWIFLEMCPFSPCMAQRLGILEMIKITMYTTKKRKPQYVYRELLALRYTLARIAVMRTKMFVDRYTHLLNFCCASTRYHTQIYTLRHDLDRSRAKRVSSVSGSFYVPQYTYSTACVIFWVTEYPRMVDVLKMALILGGVGGALGPDSTFK